MNDLSDCCEMVGQRIVPRVRHRSCESLPRPGPLRVFNPLLTLQLKPY